MLEDTPPPKFFASSGLSRIQADVQEPGDSYRAICSKHLMEEARHRPEIVMSETPQSTLQFFL
jgi:hypothetical protein